MCFDRDSVPPIFIEPKTEIRTAASVILTSADGSRFSAFLAQPDQLSGTGVIVLPDMRGLHPFYEQLVCRLAEQGHTTIAIDYYGRTAGTGSRDHDFPFMKHIFQVTRKNIGEDIMAGAQYIRELSQAASRGLFALGFCFGGRQAFFVAAPEFQMNGVIGFYGAPSFYPNGAAGPTQHAREFTAPILAIFGGADTGIPANDVAAFDDALKQAAVPHEIITYPNAPHSFFDIKYKEHLEACQDAWQRTLDFIAEKK